EGVGQDKSQRSEILNLGTVYARTSDTIGIELLYIASSLDDGGYLRISIPLETQTSIYNKVTSFIIIGAVLISILYYFSLIKISKNLLTPLEKVKKGLIALNEGNYQVMSLNSPYNDINELLYEMNQVNLETAKYLRQVESYQKHLDTVLNQLKQAVLLFDQYNLLVYFNYDAEVLFGLSKTDINHELYEVLRNHDLKEAIIETNKYGKEYHFDLTMADVIYEAKTIKLLDEIEFNQQPTVLVILKNVQQERQLAQVKRDFFAHASHELKSPLTAISGNAELIAHGIIKKEKDIRESAITIFNQTTNMSLLVEDMLMLSRLEQVQPTMMETQNLNVLLKLTIESLKIFIDNKKMKIIIDESPVTMKCDPLDMQKLFKNLIENAIKYSQINKEIHLMLHKEKHDVNFTIIDQGYGISNEHQQRVFERFYRVDKGRLDGGTGLGLAIVKHIVIKYKGEIKLSSELGEGTKIEIKLCDE
ncbi:MAG: ATP-binding protein, partial [Acholeplasmataceae bacterium]